MGHDIAFRCQSLSPTRQQNDRLVAGDRCLISRATVRPSMVWHAEISNDRGECFFAMGGAEELDSFLPSAGGDHHVAIHLQCVSQ
jgi:hypothetical protein